MGDRTGKTRVFISYSRKDLVEAEALRERLTEAGFDAYLDTHDIVKGEPWRDRLRGLIESADAVIFLISPDSLASDVCSWELNEAEYRNKRLFPVVLRDVASDAAPQRLQRLNYTFLNVPENLESEVSKLVQALAEDAGWVREHTRLGELAGRWDRAKRPARLLLRGSDLKAAETWRDTRQPSAPQLTRAQSDFIAVSRRAQARRRLTTVAGAMGVLLIASLAFAFLSLLESNLSSSQIAQSRALAGAARTQLANGEAALGVALALEALPSSLDRPDRPFVADAETALAYVASAYRPMIVISAPSGATTDAAAAGDEIVIGSDAGRLWTIDALTGEERRVLIESGPSIAVVAGAANGAVAAGLANGALLVWPAQGEAYRLDEPQGPISYLAFAAGGATLIATTPSSFDAEAPRLGRMTWRRVEEKGAVFLDEEGDVRVSISQDGRWAAVVEAEEPIRVHRADTGEIAPGLSGPPVYSNDPVSLSNDGRYLAYGSWQGVGLAADLALGETAPLGEGLTFRTSMTSAMSANGVWAAFAARSGAVEVWRRDLFGLNDEGAPDLDKPRTWAADGVLELKANFEQQETPYLAISPGSSRLAIGLAGGRLSLVDGLSSFSGYGVGELTSVDLRLFRAQAPLRVSFIDDERVLVKGDQIAIINVLPAAPGLKRLEVDLSGADHLEDMVDHLRALPKNAGWRLIGQGRLGESQGFARSERFRAQATSLGDVLVTDAKGDRISRIDTGGQGVNVLAILPGEREVAVGLTNRRLLIADLASGGIIRAFETGMSPPETLFVDSKGDRLLAFTFESQRHDGAFELSLRFARCRALMEEARGYYLRPLSDEERSLFETDQQASPLMRAYMSIRQPFARLFSAPAPCPSG